MILAVAGEKGGVGKTTIATNITIIKLHEEQLHNDILLIDTDIQKTASYFCALRDEQNISPRTPSVQKQGKEVRTEVNALREKYKDIIIDAGGRDSPELRASLLVADKVLFPLRPSQFDLWTLDRLNSLVDTAREINPSLDAAVVMNQTSPNPGVKELDKAIELIENFDELRVLKTHVCERIVFRRAAEKGLSVTEYKPKDAQAIKEIMNLYEDIYYE